MAYTRRQFLKMMTTTAVGTAFFTACQTYVTGVPARNFIIQSPAHIPEDLATGIDNYYATVCQQCSAQCGILVRVMEGRAKKVEGNPDFPTNLGKHCARGEASLQALYHPDRLSGPLRRAGERGSGQFQPISWDSALDELVGHLRQLQDSQQTDTLLTITEPISGHRALVINRFLQAFGGDLLTFGSPSYDATAAALIRIFGQNQLPAFAIDEAQYLLSFGADFLGTWLAPVPYGRMYGEFRQGNRQRGRLVQIEPRFSTTAANADLWIPNQAGTEGVLALSIAQVILSEGLADANAANSLTGGIDAGALDAFTPEKASTTTGVPVDTIRQIARDFAKNRPSLALGGGPAAGQSNGFFNLNAIYALNFLVGSVGSGGPIRFNPGPPIHDLPAMPPPTAIGVWQQLVQRLQSGQPKAVNAALIHKSNPVYGLPAELKFGEALAQATFIASFSSFIDETTAMADLILPDHVFLEDWGDGLPNPGPGFAVFGMQQPVVRPVGDTRGFADVMLTTAEELGGEVQRALPWNTFRDVLRDGAQQLRALTAGSVQSGDFEDFWQKMLQQGGWWDEQMTAGPSLSSVPTLLREAKVANFEGAAEDFPFNLIVFPSNSLLDGQDANLPWLQALPDPTSTVVWESWLEIDPKTAEKLGIITCDILAVESTRGKIETSAYVHPATPPGVVSMPTGQGHTLFTRYAQGRGSNPMDIIAALVDDDTGVLATSATRVRISKTGRSINLPKFEGTVPAEQLSDANVVPTVNE